MVCSLCNRRKVRRGCPALGAQICAVCCGTKRLVQIQCPSDCAYLNTARQHPPAAALRRQQRDTSLLLQSMRDLNQRQSQLFFLVNRFLLRYQPPDLQQLTDDDVAEAAAALAATIETSLRGVIYEHRPASLPAQRLMNALKPLVTDMNQKGGTAAERDAAVVMRRIADAAREVSATEAGSRRAFLDLLGRLMRTPDEEGGPRPEPSVLI